MFFYFRYAYSFGRVGLQEAENEPFAVIRVLLIETDVPAIHAF